jgi:molecular chaperone DnaJ
MNPKIQQAYQILEIQPESNEEEVKKQFKKLARKYHPDNKETGSEEKFKEINAAYELIQNKDNIQENSDFGGMNIEDIINHFNGFGGFGGFSNFVNVDYYSKQRPPTIVSLTLTFEESILGCKKKIDYVGYKQCDECKGNKRKLKNEICLDCNGQGKTKQKVNGRNSQTFVLVCNSCKGTGKKTEECKKCSGYGTIEDNKSKTLTIPEGIMTLGNQMKIPDGNHLVIVKINVTPDKEMQLINNNVVSKLNVSLLECLEGCKKTIRTVHGEKEITIPEKSKHQQLIHLSGFGVKNQNGDHIVIVDLEYPEDKINDIINILKK